MKDLLLRTGAQALHAVQDTLNDPQKREARLVRPTKAVARGVGTAARFSLAFVGFVMSGMAAGSSSRDDDDETPSYLTDLGNERECSHYDYTGHPKED